MSLRIVRKTALLMGFLHSLTDYDTAGPANDRAKECSG
jgi:hypothetical protein